MLLIDIGNTRVKWASLHNDVVGEQHAMTHANWSAQDVHDRIIATSLRPSDVLISNVGGARIGQLLTDAIKTAWNIAPRFVRASATAAGVRCGYSQPEKLGVDRWLAAIAGFHLTRTDVCIVSVGTAMTVDGVLRDGQHLGGVITPGPDMMIGSLMQNTSDIAAHALNGQQRATLFADNTLAAVQQGAVHALAALAERAVNDMHKQFGRTPVLLLTGGASDKVAREVRIPFQVVPDLVLRGLAILSKDAVNVSA
jgi:type III pantothenate kinase